MTKKTFPRLETGIRNDRIVSILGLTSFLDISEYRESLSNAEFFSWSNVEQVRVTDHDLDSFIQGLIELATRNGYPDKSFRESDVVRAATFDDQEIDDAFDSGLLSLVLKNLDITVAEAADDAVWDALRIGLVPDITLWRCPPIIRVDGQGQPLAPEPNYLWTDRRRGFLKQAWWYGHVLGPDLARELNARELADILERSSIGRLSFFAREIAEEYIALKATSGFEKISMATEKFRVAIKSIRRQMGLISVSALSKSARTSLIRRELEVAFGKA